MGRWPGYLNFTKLFLEVTAIKQKFNSSDVRVF